MLWFREELERRVESLPSFFMVSGKAEQMSLQQYWSGTKLKKKPLAFHCYLFAQISIISLTLPLYLLACHTFCQTSLPSCLLSVSSYFSLLLIIPPLLLCYLCSCGSSSFIHSTRHPHISSVSHLPLMPHDNGGVSSSLLITVTEQQILYDKGRETCEPPVSHQSLSSPLANSQGQWGL